LFSFARRDLLCLAAAALKAQDELAALGLATRARTHLPDICCAQGAFRDVAASDFPIVMVYLSLLADVVSVTVKNN
jgi:hypothetical protein